ncbi:hypothetical protein Bca101_024017 [Brassica carinata]
MDPTNPLNPYSESPSLSYLLQSQNNFQYGSFPPTENFGGPSEIPRFSTQAPDPPAGQECSQTSSTTVGDEEVRPQGSKAAKARKNNTQGLKSIDEIKSVYEWKKEEFMSKEKLSKYAILDTLLAKPAPLSESEVYFDKMGRFSWLGTLESSDYSGNQAESGYSETDELIARDQAELDLKYREKMVRLELLVCDLAKKSSTLKHGFEVTIGVLLLALVLLGLLMVFK